MPVWMPTEDGDAVYIPGPNDPLPPHVVPSPVDPGDGSALNPPETDDTYALAGESAPEPSQDELDAAELDALAVDDAGYSVMATGSAPGAILGGVDAHLSRALGCAACPFSGPSDHRTSGRACALRCWQSNNAVDIALPVGFAVRAVRDGYVDPNMGYGLLGTSGVTSGYRLHVRHPSGMISWYQHMRPPLRPRGSQVKQGDVLGYVGYWGFVTHLHLAVTPPYDPVPFAPYAWSKLGRQPPQAPKPGGDVTVTPAPWVAPKAPGMEDEWRHLVKTQWQHKRRAQTAMHIARKRVAKLLQ